MMRTSTTSLNDLTYGGGSVLIKVVAQRALHIRSFFGLRNVAQYTLGYALWCIIRIFLGLLMRKVHKESARLNFSPKYCSTIAKEAINLKFLCTMKK